MSQGLTLKSVLKHITTTHMRMNAWRLSPSETTQREEDECGYETRMQVKMRT